MGIISVPFKWSLNQSMGTMGCGCRLFYLMTLGSNCWKCFLVIGGVAAELNEAKGDGGDDGNMYGEDSCLAHSNTVLCGSYMKYEMAGLYETTHFSILPGRRVRSSETGVLMISLYQKE